MEDSLKSNVAPAGHQSTWQHSLSSVESLQSGQKTKHHFESFLCQRFVDLFQASPKIYTAPGRVNLIGEHTDYSDGFVMPAAVGIRTWAAISPRADCKLVVHSENFSEQAECDLNCLPSRASGHWSDYVLGVAKMLSEAGHHLIGANLLLHGELPLGAGLSSSASVEVVTGYALLAIAGLPVHLTDLALASQRAENNFVGARCGIMDQFICVHAKEGQAILLDCRSLDYRALPIDEDVRLVICNTMVKHSNSTGEYNLRRVECEDSVAILSKHIPHVRALRDVTLADLNKFGHSLPDKLFRRSRHIVTENDRVRCAADALEQQDLQSFGRLMRKSHESLRDDFEVSCSELDLMVALAERTEGVYGSRMTGGGFGGCTISLVDARHVNSFKSSVAQAYQDKTRLTPEIYICSAASGVGCDTGVH